VRRDIAAFRVFRGRFLPALLDAPPPVFGLTADENPFVS
jgi:hypothetical protein